MSRVQLLSPLHPPRFNWRSARMTVSYSAKWEAMTSLAFALPKQLCSQYSLTVASALFGTFRSQGLRKLKEYDLIMARSLNVIQSMNLQTISSSFKELMFPCLCSFWSHPHQNGSQPNMGRKVQADQDKEEMVAQDNCPKVWWLRPTGLVKSCWQQGSPAFWPPHDHMTRVQRLAPVNWKIEKSRLADC